MFRNDSRAAALAKQFVMRTYPEGVFWFFAAGLTGLNAVWLAFDPSLNLTWKWYIAAGGFLALAAISALGVVSLNNSQAARIFHRILCAVSAYAFAKFTYLQLRTQNFLSMSLSEGWVDDWLANLDRSAGFNWQGYVDWVTGNPIVFWLLRQSYGWVDGPIATLAVILIAFGFRRDVRDLFGVLFVTSTACMWVAVAFPAKAAVATLGTPALIKLLGKSAGRYHIKIIENLRSDLVMYFDPENIPGLAAFPSFHTALGVVMIYAARRNRALLFLTSLYALCMIAATPVFGGHYFVDLIAGTVSALAVILLWHRLIAPRLPDCPDDINLFRWIGTWRNS